ncbi:MAG: hypothetical protein JXB19_04380 [Bacteroidales bacterium]|nr:hypothetical protein [Bacteroidales bacterium]
MNYNCANRIYRKYGTEDKLSDGSFQRTGRELANTCKHSGIKFDVGF